MAGIDLTPWHEVIIDLHLTKKFGATSIASLLAQRGVRVSFKTVKRYLREVNAWKPEQVVRCARKESTCVICNKRFQTRSIGKYCKICVPDKRSLAMWQLYGITKAQYEIEFRNQNSSCAICCRDLTQLPQKQVHIDHDHITNRFRGILCAKCNNGLGFIERPGFLNKALAYLGRR